MLKFVRDLSAKHMLALVYVYVYTSKTETEILTKALVESQLRELSEMIKVERSKTYLAALFVMKECWKVDFLVCCTS